MILTTPDEIQTWLTAPVESEARKLRRPLPDRSLKIIAAGARPKHGDLAARRATAGSRVLLLQRNISFYSACEGRGVPLYSFFLINHLGEPFEASECSFDSDREACAHAEAIASRRGYPVEVKSDGVRIKLAPLMTWKAEEWLDRTRPSQFFASRGVHPRLVRPPSCVQCRRPMDSADAKLCETCRSTPGGRRVPSERQP